MTENPDIGQDEEAIEPEGFQPEDLTLEDEEALLSDTSADNGESDLPDPEQDFDIDEIDEEPDYETED